MISLRVTNVNVALPLGMDLLTHVGVERNSRNGRVLQVMEPVSTHYLYPWECVLFHPDRDANPFFHLFEALWMLAGHNDVTLPAHFVSRMRDYSDDGRTLNGAYGHRWRYAFNFDQLVDIEALLRANPDDRRVVLSMWHPQRDGRRWGAEKDVPCNLSVLFQIAPFSEQNDVLNMTVFNRSNDMIWGAYGTNAVQMALLQEFLANRLGYAIGWYEQVSTNFHAYHTTFDPLLERMRDSMKDPHLYDFYHPSSTPNPVVTHLSLGAEHPHFLMDVDAVLSCIRNGDHTVSDHTMHRLTVPFVRDVCAPMANAHAAYRRHDFEQALTLVQGLPYLQMNDWLTAGRQWLTRRIEKWGPHEAT